VRKGAAYDPRNLASCLVNPACDEAE